VHKDHYDGVAKLHDYYRDASFHYPSALSTTTFNQLWGIDIDEELLGDLAGVLDRAGSRHPSSGRPGRRKLQVDSNVYDINGVHVRALSPSDEAITQADTDLATVIASADRLAIGQHLKEQNMTSVVLHVDAGHCAAILGADLERSPRSHGWHAIVANPDFAHLAHSSLLKVPHHGSENADADVIWSRLMTSRPHLLVAPFWNSRLPRTDRDIPRLTARGHCLWQAAPSSRWVSRPDGSRFSLPRTTGRVTARRGPGDQDWSIHRVLPALAPRPGSKGGLAGTASPTCALDEAIDP
jgi:hypothetical protein